MSGTPNPSAEIVTLLTAEPETVAPPSEADLIDPDEAETVTPTSAQTQSGETLEPAGDRPDR